MNVVAHPARVGGHPLPRGSGEIPQEHEPRSPQQATGRVVEQELAIRDLGHAGEAGNHHAKSSGEPSEEDCGASSAAQVRLRALEVLVDPVAEERHAATDPAEDLAPPPATDEVAARVPDDRARDGRGHDRGERAPTVEREYPS